MNRYKLNVAFRGVLTAFCLNPLTALSNSACDDAKVLLKQATQGASAEEQISLAESSVAKCPSYQGYTLLGFLYMETNQSEPALQAYEQAVKLAPQPDQRASALGGKAKVLANQGKFSEATANYDLANELYQASGKTPPEAFINAYRALADDQSKELQSADDLARILDARRSLRSSLLVVARDTHNTAAPLAAKLNVLFNYDSNELDAAGKKQAKALGEALTRKQFKGAKILLLGHTDIRGKRPYNQTLSENRAKSVQAFLEEQFPKLKGHLQSEGKGANQPRFRGTSENDHRLNRRVEVILSPAS